MESVATKTELIKGQKTWMAISATQRDGCLLPCHSAQAEVAVKQESAGIPSGCLGSIADGSTLEVIVKEEQLEGLTNEKSEGEYSLQCQVANVPTEAFVKIEPIEWHEEAPNDCLHYNSGAHKAEVNVKVEVRCSTNAMESSSLGGLQQCKDDKAVKSKKERPVSIANAALAVSQDSTLEKKEKADLRVLNRYSCDVCFKSYKFKFNLKQHMDFHGNKRFQCEECPKKYFRNLDLIVHKENHKIKPVKCQQCEFRCADSDGLLFHVMSIHWGTFRFKCGECSAKFKTSSCLQNHRRSVHSKVKLYKCEICGRDFSTNCGMNGHLKVHLDTKPYRCMVCPKTYKSGSGLAVHMALHHKQINTSK